MSAMEARDVNELTPAIQVFKIEMCLGEKLEVVTRHLYCLEEHHSWKLSKCSPSERQKIESEWHSEHDGTIKQLLAERKQLKEQLLCLAKWDTYNDKLLQ